MQWSAEPGGGFTRPGVVPWLPLGDVAGCNVGSQRDDPGSTLRFCRDLVAARRRREELRRGSMTWLPSPSGVLAWRRGSGHAVAVNLGDRPATVAGLTGHILVATDPGRAGEPIVTSLSLPGRSGVLLDLG